MSKYAHYPPAALSFIPEDLTTYGGELFGIVFAASPHALVWGTLREYGPVPNQRWDPHPSPTATHPGCGVLYAATTIQCALAEVFQVTRRIDVTADAPTILVWRPNRSLQLLDLTDSKWLIRNGAADALVHADTGVCQRWAAAIHEQKPELDGLQVPSTMHGTNIVLFQRAIDSFPPTPLHERALTDPTMLRLIHAEAAEIGYTVDMTPSA